jgi:transcriptional regulator with XRE-family HTH domain
MGVRERAETQFGRRMREERKRLRWSQEDLAERMTAKGVHTYASTIAKIESERQPRAPRLAEIVVIADLFGVSIDSLLGRQPGIENDLSFTLWTLLDSVRKALQQISTTAGTLHSRAAELNRFEFDGRETLQDAVLQATASLAQAMQALAAVSFFDLPDSASTVAELKAAVDRQGVELQATTIALFDSMRSNAPPFEGKNEDDTQ